MALSLNGKLVTDSLNQNEKSEKKRRYVLFNQQDVSEIWNHLTLSLAINEFKNEDPSFIEEPIKTTDQIFGEELHCRTCLTSFTEKDDYRLHYRDDLHRYNLKLKLIGKPPVTQQEFCEIEDGISSISGSDSEEDSSDRTAKVTVGTPKIYFQNQKGQKMAVYRCLLHSKKKPTNNEEELIQLIQNLPKQNMWAIIMLGGTEIVNHKTFHSYTVRAKQGGGQSSRDNKSGGGSHPKSAGASLRRYNEAAFAEHVQSLFICWCDVLKKCNMIFYRAASSNQTIMFGGKNPFFDRSDARLRSIPFPTRRATLKEVRRVWLQLATIELVGKAETDEMQEGCATEIITTTDNLKLDSESTDDELKIVELQRAKRMKKKIAAKNSSNIAIQSVEINVDDKDLFPGENEIRENIFLAIKRGNSDLLDKEIEKLSEILDSYREEYQVDITDVLNHRLGDSCETLLHQTASMNKRAPFVWKLMDLGCDPSLSDASGRVPYMLASDKETRATFRRFMGAYPDRYDYVKAAIPSPLTEEIEKQKAEKLAEKRKIQKQAKKEKKATEKAKMDEEKRKQEELRLAEEEKRKAEEDRARFLALSDREKRALAAERRLLANTSTVGLPTPVLVRCLACGVDISGKVPFEYSGNKRANRYEMMASVNQNSVLAAANNTGQPQPNHNVKYTFSDGVVTVLSLVLYVADIVTDIILGVKYINAGYFEWGTLTLVLCILPSILTQCISLRWHQIDQTAISLPMAVSHVSLLGIVHRYAAILNLGVRKPEKKAFQSNNQQALQLLCHYQSDVCLLRLFESFLESAPQLLLQLYVMYELDSWHPWTGISAVGSLLSLAWGHTSQLVYYRWFHPSGPIQFKASSPAPVEEIRQNVLQAGVTFSSCGEQPIPSFSPVFMMRTLKHMNRKFSGVSLASALIEPVAVSTIKVESPGVPIENNNPRQDRLPYAGKTEVVAEVEQPKHLGASRNGGVKSHSDSRLLEMTNNPFEARMLKTKSDGQLHVVNFLPGKMVQTGLLCDGADSKSESSCTSVHDYENMVFVNVNRTDWGIRHWKSYSDIETSYHDNSVCKEREPLESSINSTSSNDSTRILPLGKLSMEEAIAQLKSLATHGHNVYQRPDENTTTKLYEVIWLNETETTGSIVNPVRLCPTNGHNLSIITELSESNSTASAESKSSLVQTVDTIMNKSSCDSSIEGEHLTYVEISFLSKLSESSMETELNNELHESPKKRPARRHFSIIREKFEDKSNQLVKKSNTNLIEMNKENISMVNGTPKIQDSSSSPIRQPVLTPKKRSTLSPESRIFSQSSLKC
ncbi:hypothetical protein GHT06_019368 [Daphnia sinensis]|uniref:XK-related protein n=1 Tax=Daphnia sinensis TaxID=1820382 RepID=A0AAD5L168_9CRUS|nr:hypothetical protein GHT06_019368 [Daphnia sinensis]